jgi:disulfide bond formation protein DsbB
MGARADWILKRWPFFAFAISAAMLAIAHAFETFGRLPPCHLCLQQRQAYWDALFVSAIAVIVQIVRPSALTPRIAGLALAGVFGYGAYLAGFHAGAEWKWWPAPASCASGGPGVSTAAIKALLSGRAVAMPPCDRPAWIFLGLSMAGWNFLVSVSLAVASLAAAVRREKRQ